MKSILIRTLGGKGIGYGHYYRCLSLAKAILYLNKNIDIIFLINNELVTQIKNTNFKYILENNLEEDYRIIEELKVDLFIFDSYLGSNEYLKEVKKKTRLMLIDDNNDIYNSLIPDILYNGNIHAKKLNYNMVKGQLALLGSEYLIMREEYWDSKLNIFDKKEGILITTGGTDEYGVAYKIVSEIKDLGVKIRVIIGPSYKDDYIKEIEKISNKNIELVYSPNSLKNYLSYSEIVITAGGSTIYEVLAQKCIPVVFSIADNQDLICQEMKFMGVEYLGKYPNIEYFRLRDVIRNIQHEERNINSTMFEIINSRGALMVAKKILDYIC